MDSKSGKPWLFGLATGPAGTTASLPLERMRKRWRAGHSGVHSLVAPQAKWNSQLRVRASALPVAEARCARGSNMQGFSRSGNFGELIVTRVGVYVYGMATIAAGIFHLLWGDFDVSHQPIRAFGDHIPGRELFAYITAVWMIAGGAAILWRRTAKAGAAALAVIYFIFAIFWLPRFYTAPHVLGFRIPVYIGVLGGVGTQLIVVAAGALVYASLSMHSSSWPRTILIARWIFGLCSVDFGLLHLTGVEDNAVYVPNLDASGRRVLGDRNWNLLHTRRRCHTPGNSGRSACPAPRADAVSL
jgi:uncharacterized membrane protein YphA (DoxX/SURF4 family)